jgi:peptide-methionine (S)-S-oxide reductase
MVKTIPLLLFWAGFTTILSACNLKDTPMQTTTPPHHPSSLDTITLGNGCFWCTEAIYQQTRGVISVNPGYSGGTIKNPAYREVCTGRTGHAEVVQVVFDTQQVSLAVILEIFFKTHDPTTLNRQGADVGTQYRSAIFYHHPAQQVLATSILKDLDAAGIWPNPIVTEVTPFTQFYPAEPEHLAYYERNPEQAYCRAVILPKLEKFKKVFAEYVAP